MGSKNKTIWYSDGDFDENHFIKKSYNSLREIGTESDNSVKRKWKKIDLLKINLVQ